MDAFYITIALLERRLKGYRIHTDSSVREEDNKRCLLHSDSSIREEVKRGTLQTVIMLLEGRLRSFRDTPPHPYEREVRHNQRTVT